MFESSKQEMAGFEEDSSKIFVGLNFVLLGFDSTTQQKVRSKIVEGGGVDAGQYGTDCTHVIVDKVVYDDPICVAARSQGQTLVTSLWVEHSFDVGMLVDPASIIYRPLRDLNGIPGAKSLVICLTGYIRQDRDDIMTMVGLMGANFSKPLVANKVTHLICYKFEGEKYELAKKIKKIKLVNHQWLEDCLKTWQILPEADYDKSGYELEMMEVQAKDSEDEAQHTATEQQMQKEGASIWESLSAREKEAKPNEVPIQKVTPSRCAEIPASSPTGNAGNSCSGLPLQSMDRTPFQPNIGSDFSSVSNINKKSPQSSVSKYIALSCSRKSPREASLPLEPVQTEGNAGSFPVAELGKPLVNDCTNLSSSRMEEGTVTAGVKSLLEENLSHLEDGQSGILPIKRKVANSFSGSKLQRTDNNLDFVSEGASDVNRTEQSAPEPLTNKLLGFISHSPGNNPSNADSDADFNPQKDSPENSLSSVTPEIRQECSEKVLQMSSQKRKRTNLDSSPEVADVISNRPESAFNESMKPHNGEVPPPAANVNGVGKSNASVLIDFSEGDGSSGSKPLRKKPMAKRTLGSRPRFGRGKTGNQKGPFHMSKKVSIKNSPTGPIEGEETEDLERRVSSERIKVIFPPTDAELDKDSEMMNFLEIRNGETNKAGTADDETEAPENQENNEFDAIVNKEKSGDVDVDVPHLVDTRTGGKVVENKQTDDKIILTEDELLICGEENLIVEADNAPSDNKMEQCESTFIDNNCRKHTLTETEKKTLSSRAKLGNSSEGGRRKGAKLGNSSEGGRRKGAKLGNSSEGGRRKGAKNGSSTEKANTNKARGSRGVLDGNMILAPVDMSKKSIEMEKENRPVHTGTFNVNHKKKLIGKLTRGSNRKFLAKDVANTGSESVPGTPKVRIDPVWFILSGHKVQRKEFKQVIRHLKGRLCRDSHQWTYQATHFIVPDPLRRTEKFFAAAASGRWILKTDYLTASNEAGRFLAEEPYEWHRKGLNEDGAINLEAPRKWRLLRERTGHGAFYGMRIIIYGECIAPPLDTLKRVVKAGDGSILATSPPYSRFLESGGVDFAIVSPGMPRVDIWVQEFLRHEIPCVSADYLVEYVCKPGYPLDRHVQYNTLAWAEKSFRNLENRTEQVVEDSTPQKDQEEDEDDTRCHVCGSRENGEEMLICGDESGSSGCGIGAHIGCCDPPLEEIPEEDWFCEKCRNRKNTEKRCRKSVSASKRK